jgi:hypothetical protein
MAFPSRRAQVVHDYYNASHESRMMRNLVARAFHSWDLYNSEARQVQKDNVVALRSELQKADKKHHETRATKAQLLLKCGPKVGRSRPYSILRITFETLPGFHEASCFGK